MKFALFILGSFFSAYAFAGVYKCTDAGGKTAYSENPCAAGASNMKLNVKTGSAVNLDEIKNQQTAEQQQQQALIEQQKLEQQQLLQKQEKLKQDAIDESAKNQFLIKNNPQKFSPFAIPTYKPDQLPALVKLHQDRLPEIERMRRKAAEKALASGECKRVESVELNIKSTKSALVFLVDCSTAKRFYITEQELAQ
jgi:hypothetical protein